MWTRVKNERYKIVKNKQITHYYSSMEQKKTVIKEIRSLLVEKKGTTWHKNKTVKMCVEKGIKRWNWIFEPYSKFFLKVTKILWLFWGIWNRLMAGQFISRKENWCNIWAIWASSAAIEQIKLISDTFLTYCCFRRAKLLTLVIQSN